ncbi:hypothetical protein R1flu_009144 [Riccia fluitans]|uniref:Serine-threonine/tyrosine-protein kinase catalytic domain-containing protein n=1 Tax=Riccia fluitans TaxID=41844 RepID=A0ABD1Z491_9MARC
MRDGRGLAVKKPEPTEQNVADFFTEVVNITDIKHRHLIQLMGCSVRDNQRRLLIYEYAENRSLAEALWAPHASEYSTREILRLKLDATAQFMLEPAMVHRGYLSPEYASRGIVSEKLVVYSFGIVLLEIKSGRKWIDRSMPEAQIYLPDWVSL